MKITKEQPKSRKAKTDKSPDAEPVRPAVLDTVTVTDDLPDSNVKAGDTAVVLENLGNPVSAHLVEVVSEDGQGSEIGVATPEQIELAQRVVAETMENVMDSLPTAPERSPLGWAREAYELLLATAPEGVEFPAWDRLSEETRQNYLTAAEHVVNGGEHRTTFERAVRYLLDRQLTA